MEVGAIVQARTGSRRLPGKVLREIGGKPLVQYLLERLERSAALDGIVVATSSDESDNAIVELCLRLGVSCHRGPLEDVAGRVRETLEDYPFDAFVRVGGDSPLLDQRLVDRGIGLFRGGGFDLVTNVMPRTFPPGQSVEVVESGAFRRACAAMESREDLEHVTRFFYQHPESFRIHNFEAERSYDGLDLAVDTERELAAVAALVAKMDRPHWEYGLAEIAELSAGVGR